MIGLSRDSALQSHRRCCLFEIARSLQVLGLWISTLPQAVQVCLKRQWGSNLHGLPASQYVQMSEEDALSDLSYAPGYARRFLLGMSGLGACRFALTGSSSDRMSALYSDSLSHLQIGEV